MLRPYWWIAAAALLSASCSAPKKMLPDFDALTQDFVYGSLALSPVSATAAGYHENYGEHLDEMLDDYGPAGIAADQTFIASFEQRVAELDPSTLNQEQRADLEIITNNLGLSHLELDTIQSYKHNPTVYVELIGNALFSPYVLNYAPAEKRFDQISKRIEKVPTLLDQAKANLVDAPEVWNRVAREENRGNIELIDKTLRAAVPKSVKTEYDKAADTALPALRDFNTYLEKDLSKKTSDWRLGKDKYDRKFAYTLATGKTPEQLLAQAETQLQTVRAKMQKLAAPQTVEQALAEVARHHPTPETYIAYAKKTLEQATAFVKQKDLVDLLPGDNLKVIETPEFMRGIYGVGGFDPAPALEPQLGAFYWITPIPKDWPKDRIESKLREYNDYGIQELTIHEAMPGHSVQFAYANAVQPNSRRLLRAVFANGPYVEGYAVYAQQMMSDEGYLDNSKDLWLTFYKQILRVLANTILDIRLQTMGMTDQQALDLMINQTYQEKEEATAKLQRAQLSSCQLPTYFAGWTGWLEARDNYKKRKGSAYSLREFNDAALKESAVSIPMLDKLLQ
ncbi:MAG: DUF885 domain-containing protein [Bryobacteraceae bacterium]